MKDAKLPPPGWSENKLTRFIDDARDNQWGTFANKTSAKKIVEIDNSFCRAIDGFQINPPDDSGPPFQIFFRAHCSYRAAASCAFAGHATELHPLLRSMLEQAGYALLMHGNSEMQKVWQDRHKSDDDHRKVPRAFAVGKIKDKIASLDPGLRDFFETLYETTIDFGAHPNPMSVLSGTRKEEIENKMILNLIYLHKDGDVLEYSLRMLALSGLCVLHIFQEMFRDRFELCGVSSELLRLRKNL